MTKEKMDEPGLFVVSSAAGSPVWAMTFPTRRAAWDLARSRWGYATQARRFKADGYQIRPATWREREQLRFVSGEYTHPVWRNESFWGARPVDHFAHMSSEDPTSIAFTESPEKGERDRQTRMKAGRYLKKFFGDKLTDKQVAFFAEWAKRGARPPSDFGVVDLKFATTPEEITRVYEEGPQSCMKGSDYGVEVYGAGDLAIAYLERRAEPATPDELKIFARALVWPARKAMGRVYPTGENWSTDGFASATESQAAADQLFETLKAKGYRSFYEQGDIFDGARLIAKYMGDGLYAMPYIDKLRINGPSDGYFTLHEHGDIAADSTDGTVEIDDGTVQCDDCGAGWDREELTRVGSDMPMAGNLLCCTIAVCPDCLTETWHCDATDQDFTQAVDRVHLENGETWVASWFKENGFTCAHDLLNYPLSEESHEFEGFHAKYDADPDVHPEIVADDPPPTHPDLAPLALEPAE